MTVDIHPANTDSSVVSGTKNLPNHHDQIVFLDTSALVRRYLADRDRRLVVDAMTTATSWVASALTKTELQLALFQAAPTRSGQQALWSKVRQDWEAIWEVPVDRRCLNRSAEIGARYGLATSDAIQLAAADRIPRPCKFVTFARQQIPAAADLGFQVLSPFDA